MSMSQKDYRLIAANIRRRLDIEASEYGLLAIARLARDLANTFKGVNPDFRFDIFFEACGLDEWGNLKGEFKNGPAPTLGRYVKRV